MEVTINVSNVLLGLLLNWTPPGEDELEVIGDSRVAYLSRKDPAHIFLAAARWHDAAYKKGAQIQKEMPRWRVDKHFLDTMLELAQGDLSLQKEACTLYLIVRQHGGKYWEGEE